MTDYSFPLSTARPLVERIEAPPAGVSPHRWVLRDDNQQHYHGRIRLDDDPAYIELHWKPDGRGREQLVGLYRLHLVPLVDAGYARLEGPGPKANDVRVRFHRGDRGVVFVQVRQDTPGLPIGTIDSSLG
jgi:hypothetical protein